MNLRQLEIFLKVAQAGSFSRAAISLDVVQPVLSRQVRLLEEELKVDLLYRDGRGIKLTAAGKCVLEHSRSVLTSIESLKTDLLGLSGARLAALTIALSPTLSTAIIRPLTSEVLRRYPDIKLRLLEGVSGDINEWLASGRVDVAVTYHTSSIARMNFEELCSEPLYLVAPKAWKPYRASLKFAELSKVPLIAPGRPHGLRVLLDAKAKAAGIDLKIRLEADHFATIKLLVDEGLGCATLPLSSIREEVKVGKFRISRIGSPELKRKLVLITRSGRVPAAGLNEVAGIIKPLIRQLCSD